MPDCSHTLALFWFLFQRKLSTPELQQIWNRQLATAYITAKKQWSLVPYVSASGVKTTLDKALCPQVESRYPDLVTVTEEDGGDVSTMSSEGVDPSTFAPANALHPHKEAKRHLAQLGVDADLSSLIHMTTSPWTQADMPPLAIGATKTSVPLREAQMIQITAPARAVDKWNFMIYSCPIAYAGMTGLDPSDTAEFVPGSAQAYQTCLETSIGMDHLNTGGQAFNTIVHTEILHRAFWVGIKYLDGEDIAMENWQQLPVDSFIALQFSSPFGEQPYVCTGNSLKVEYTGPEITASGSLLAWRQPCIATTKNMTLSGRRVAPATVPTAGQPLASTHIAPYPFGPVTRIPPPPGMSARNRLDATPNLTSQTLDIKKGVLLVSPTSWKTMHEDRRNPISILDMCDPYASATGQADQHVHYLFPANGQPLDDANLPGAWYASVYGRFVHHSECRAGAHFQGMEIAATLTATAFVCGYREPSTAADIWTLAAQRQRVYDPTEIAVLERVSEELPVAAPASANGFGSWLKSAVSTIGSVLKSPVAKAITRPLREIGHVVAPRITAAIETGEEIAKEVIPGAVRGGGRRKHRSHLEESPMPAVMRGGSLGQRPRNGRRVRVDTNAAGEEVITIPKGRVTDAYANPRRQ